jgi:hypothetical protein
MNIDPLSTLRRLFRKKRYLPHDCLVSDGGRHLFRLKFVAWGDNCVWQQFQVIPIKGTWALWNRTCRPEGFYDALGWVLIDPVGRQVPIEHFLIAIEMSGPLVSIKYVGNASQTPHPV